jgi:DNA-binding NarL/FixJ family response regulator
MLDVKGAVITNVPDRPAKSVPKALNIDSGRDVSSVRILVVDDYEPFRRFICSMLRTKPDLQVVCEVSDGLEAVQKAEALQPDLIVLDIGLPGLNGIEAARRIRQLSPLSKLLFVSQQFSADVVQEALNSGALGYVVKPQAASEFLPAVASVLLDKQFVSGNLLDGDGHH